MKPRFAAPSLARLAVSVAASLTLVAGLALSSPRAEAGGVTPLAVAIIPPVQFPPNDFAVAGLRASALWGKHYSVYGIDLGLVGNMTEQHFVGVAASGIFNYNKGTTTAIGLQAAGVANINVNKAQIYGVQVALYNSNVAESFLLGLGVGAVNDSPFMKVAGIQAGLYNRANVVSGIQIGVVNVANTLHGLQIGLLNFNRTGLFAVAPILNFGF